MNFNKKLVKTALLLTLPAVFGLSSLSTPNTPSKVNLDYSIHLTFNYYPSLGFDSNSIATKAVSDKVMVSDLGVSSDFNTIDSLFSTINLDDTLKSGYLPVTKKTPKDEILGSQVYNRHRVVRKSGAEYKKDWKHFKWGKLSSLLGIKKGKANFDPAVRRDFFDRFSDEILNVTNKYSILNDEFVSLILGESGGSQFCLSPTYCVGAPQLSTDIMFPKHSFNYFVSKGVPKEINPLNVAEALDRAGMFYSFLKKSYDSDRTLALTAYNGGKSAVDSAIVHSSAYTIDAVLNAKKGSNYVLSNEARSYAKHIKSYDTTSDILIAGYLSANKDLLLAQK